jgi:hypothetical protein
MGTASSRMRTGIGELRFFLPQHRTASVVCVATCTRTIPNAVAYYWCGSFLFLTRSYSSHLAHTPNDNAYTSSQLLLMPWTTTLLALRTDTKASSSKASRMGAASTRTRTGATTGASIWVSTVLVICRFFLMRTITSRLTGHLPSSPPPTHTHTPFLLLTLSLTLPVAVLNHYKHGVTFPHANGKRHGKGVRVWASGNRYEGDWEEDKPHGKGVFTWASGERYIGAFFQGRKDGFGVCTFGDEDGNSYTCPLGVCHTNRGRDGGRMCRYEGHFRDDFRHGRGIFECANGTRYEGEWMCDERCGQGTMTMIPELERGNPRRLYIGGMDGMYRPAQYDGEWKRQKGSSCGVRDGEGAIVMPDGMRLEGQFDSGSLNGTGLVVFPSGKRRRALFKHNGIVKYLSEAEVNAGMMLEYLQGVREERK